MDNIGNLVLDLTNAEGSVADEPDCRVEFVRLDQARRPLAVSAETSICASGVSAGSKLALCDYTVAVSFGAIKLFHAH